MKNQALFSSKDKSKKIKCRLLQFLFGALRFKNLRIRQLHISILNFIAPINVSKLNCYRTDRFNPFSPRNL